MRSAIFGFCLFLLLSLNAAQATPGWRSPGEPVLTVTGDGDLADKVSGKEQSAPRDPHFVPGHGDSRAWRVSGEALIHDLPPGFDTGRGSVSFRFRPHGDSRDDTYRRFFSIESAGRGRVYVLKSGAGGSNGLFICIVDEEGSWHAASAMPGSGYEWEAGRWHRIAASWDSAAGMLQLFFDGRRVGRRQLAPFSLGEMGSRIAVGAYFNNSQPCGGDIADFRLYQQAATAEPLARAASVAGTDSAPWKAIDGDSSDAGAWTGLGAPNWLEIALPEPIDLARVVVHPGISRYAGFPSSDGSPAEFILQGYYDGAWQDLSGPVEVPPAADRRHDIVEVDTEPVAVSRFRLYITDLHDRGYRVHSPDEAVVPPDQRVVRIREVEWFDSARLAAMEQHLRELRREVRDGLQRWDRLIESAPDRVLAQSLERYYGLSLSELTDYLADLAPQDEDGWEHARRRWAHIEKWLSPWESVITAAAGDAGQGFLSGVGAPGEEAGRLRIEVDPGEGSREFYPAAVPLDMRVLESWWGVEIDPYTVQVIESDAAGNPVPFAPRREGFEAYLCPSRFERLTPGRGMLQWTMRGRDSSSYTVRFLARPEAPPDLGGVTLGNGDRFYYNHARTGRLPANLWSAEFIDWDGNGLQDAIAGRWTDFVHFYRNVGSGEEPLFHEREHYLVRDMLDEPLHANPGHHGLAFSVAHAVDFEGNGALDLFVDRYYGNRPVFHRRLERPGFPVMDSGRVPRGLESGKRAFGDLTGNGIADAVVIIAGSDEDRVVLQRGRGIDEEGRPLFAEAEDLGVEVARGPAAGTGSRRLAPALADVTDNGLLDLTVSSPPHVYFFENRGSADEPVFGAGRRLPHGDKDLDIGLYYPSVRWSDYNSSGTLDLIKSTGAQVYINRAGPGGFNLQPPLRPPLRGQQHIERSNLRCYSIVDWDGNGLLDHVIPHPRSPDLMLSRRRDDGTFALPKRIDVSPEKRDWYGCPDPAEYASLYGQLQLVDWNGDGRHDIFLYNEHTWRFGYLAYYENLGNGDFGPEVKLRPGGVGDYLQFEPGADGLGARIDEGAFLDYLSYPTAGRFDPEGGRLRFRVKPLWDADNGQTHYFFHNAPTPVARGVSVEDLRRYYTGLAPDLEIPPPFGVYKTPAGTLRLQAGESFVESPPLNWRRGEPHRVEARWGDEGLSLAIDGEVVAGDSSAVHAVPGGQRMHVGSHAWMGVQREREYPGRWAAHPVDFSFPADAVMDDLEIYDSDNELLFSLRFEGNADSDQGDTGRRLPLGYRCTPGFGDLTGNGLADMVAMIGDGRRGRGPRPEHREWSMGKLYLFPNIAKDGQLEFDDPILLRHEDGSPFVCNPRTQVTLIDWNENGLLDMILSTEGHGSARPYRGMVMFRNVGAVGNPVFAAGRPMDRLNDVLDAHHEIKVAAVDLTGNGREDMVISTDPGTRVFFRSFIEEEPVEARFRR